MISTTWMTLDSFVLTVEVMKRVDVVVGDGTVVAVIVLFMVLQLTTVVVLP